MGEYNKATNADDIVVINAKLKTEEYKGLSDKEILIKLNGEGIFITKPYVVEGGQIVHKRIDG